MGRLRIASEPRWTGVSASAQHYDWGSGSGYRWLIDSSCQLDNASDLEQIRQNWFLAKFFFLILLLPANAALVESCSTYHEPTRVRRRLSDLATHIIHDLIRRFFRPSLSDDFSLSCLREPPNDDAEPHSHTTSPSILIGATCLKDRL